MRTSVDAFDGDTVYTNNVISRKRYIVVNKMETVSSHEVIRSIAGLLLLNLPNFNLLLFSFFSSFLYSSSSGSLN
jgi:hypothetical protein